MNTVTKFTNENHDYKPYISRTFGVDKKQVIDVQDDGLTYDYQAGDYEVECKHINYHDCFFELVAIDYFWLPSGFDSWRGYDDLSHCSDCDHEHISRFIEQARTPQMRSLMDTWDLYAFQHHNSNHYICFHFSKYRDYIVINSNKVIDYIKQNKPKRYILTRNKRVNALGQAVDYVTFGCTYDRKTILNLSGVIK